MTPQIIQARGPSIQSILRARQAPGIIVPSRRIWTPPPFQRTPLQAAVGVNATANGSAGTTVVTPARATTTGSTVVVAHVRDLGSAFTSITDSQANTWVQVATELTDATAATRLYYAQNITGNAAHTFTLTKANGAFATMFMVELTGMLTSGVLDQDGRQVDAATPFTSTTETTTSANEVLVSFISANDFGTNVFAESTGFTQQVSFTNGAVNYCGSLATRIVAATAAYQASWTRTGATSCHVWLATFIEAAAATGQGQLLGQRRNHSVTFN